MVNDISFEVKSDLPKMESYMKKAKSLDVNSLLFRCGEQGASALRSSTPVETGKTAGSWSYSVTKQKNGAKIEWHNSNINHGANIAIILQYGHGTRTGGYVQGRDYINPAMRPVFDGMIEDIKKVVKS